MGKGLCIVLIIVSVVFTQSGCSMLRGGQQNLGITTNLSDSEIYVNGQFMGKGNLTTRVPRNQSVSIMAKREGYYPTTRDIGTKMSSTGILDIIGGCIILIPFIGLLFPGSKDLTSDNVSLVLNPAK